jgi:hypothetical protein
MGKNIGDNTFSNHMVMIEGAEKVLAPTESVNTGESQQMFNECAYVVSLMWLQ